MTNFRTAKYDSSEEAIGIDDPSPRYELNAADVANLALLPEHANIQRIATTTLTYTLSPATSWNVGDGMLVFLPSAGAVSFAIDGAATLNGGTTTLTRALADNASGVVVLIRIQGTNAYGLTGA